jgi:hypothetical protein
MAERDVPVRVPVEDAPVGIHKRRASEPSDIGCAKSAVSSPRPAAAIGSRRCVASASSFRPKRFDARLREERVHKRAIPPVLGPVELDRERRDHARLRRRDDRRQTTAEVNDSCRARPA